MNSSTPSYGGRSAGSKQRERIIAVTVFLFLTVSIGMQWIIPEMTADRIADQFKNEWQMDESPEVMIRAFPFFMIWQGHIQEIQIQGEGTYFGDILVEEWQFDLYEVSFKSDALENEEFSFEAGEGYARISEAALQQYIHNHSTNITDPRIVIFEEYIFYGGQWESGIINISFSARGYPYIHEDGDIHLNLENITIGPFDIPGMIREITESFIIEIIPEKNTLAFEGMKISGIFLREGFVQIEFSTTD